MEKWIERLKNIDRRVIYTTMFLCVGIPLLVPMGLPVTPSPPAEALYQEIEKLGPDDRVVLSFDYDPSTYPEVHPMALALMRHCFRRNIKVLATAIFHPTGPSLVTEAFTTLQKEFPNKKYGIDYVNLGYYVGPTTGHPQVEALCSDIFKSFPVDVKGNPTNSLKIMEGMQGLKDVQLIVTLSAGDPGIPAWVEIAHSRYQLKIAGGATAVQAPQFYPYIQSRQLCGFLGGLRGAAEYETLIKTKGLGSAGMDSQSFAHLWIMILILVGNLMILIERWQKKRSLRRLP